MNNQVLRTIRGLRESNQDGTVADSLAGLKTKAKEFDSFENFLAALTAEERAMIKQDPDYDGTEGMQDFWQKFGPGVPPTTGESTKRKTEQDDSEDDSEDDEKSKKSDDEEGDDEEGDDEEMEEDRVATEAEVLHFLDALGLIPESGGLPTVSALAKAKSAFNESTSIREDEITKMLDKKIIPEFNKGLSAFAKMKRGIGNADKLGDEASKSFRQVGGWLNDMAAGDFR